MKRRETRVGVITYARVFQRTMRAPIADASFKLAPERRQSVPFRGPRAGFVIR